MCNSFFKKISYIKISTQKLLLSPLVCPKKHRNHTARWCLPQLHPQGLLAWPRLKRLPDRATPARWSHSWMSQNQPGAWAQPLGIDWARHPGCWYVGTCPRTGPRRQFTPLVTAARVPVSGMGLWSPPQWIRLWRSWLPCPAEGGPPVLSGSAPEWPGLAAGAAAAAGQ